MTCFRSGVPVLFFSIVAAALYIYAGLPSTNWSCEKSSGIFKKCEAGSVSLWKVKNCTNATVNLDFGPSAEATLGFGNGTADCETDNGLTCCTSDLKPSFSDFKSLSLGERDGTVLSVICGALFSIIVFFVVAACKARKILLVITSFLATVFGIAAIGLWIEFDKGVIDSDTFKKIFSGSAGMGEGFMLTCGAVVANFIALLTSCAVRQTDKYEFIS